MSRLPYNPLNDSHCDACNKILETIHEPLAVAQACIDCGFPAEELRDNLLRIKQQAEAVKRHFFPHKS